MRSSPLVQPFDASLEGQILGELGYPPGIVDYSERMGIINVCTFLTFKNDLGHRFTGRAMEWPGEFDGNICFVPRGHKMGDYEATYGFVGTQHGETIIGDGMNEHGLHCCFNELEDSWLPDPTDTSLPLIDGTTMVLGSCRNIAEAIEFLAGTEFHTEPDPLTGVDDYLPYVHMAMSDRTGRSVVVEWLEDGMHVYENDVGAMTNHPRYEKQLEWLAQFNPANFDDENFYAFDRSCHGRFQHIASLNARQPAIPTDLAAINRAFAMLNSVDIVPGMLYWRDISDDPQITSVATVADVENMTYYFRTYDNYDIRKIDLGAIDFDAIDYQKESPFGRAAYRDFEFADSASEQKPQLIS